MTIDVLHDDDGVIDQHSEDKDQAEQDNHVQRIAQHLDDRERQQHGKWDCHRDEDGVSEPKESHEYQYDQNEAGNNVVLELRYHHADVMRHVAHHRDLCAGRPRRLYPFQLLFDGVRDFNDVRTGSLFDGQGDRGRAVETRARRFVFEPEDDTSHVSHVDGATVPHLHNEVLDLGGALHLGGEPHQILQTAHVDFAAGHGQVILGNRRHEIHQAELVEAQPPGIRVYMNLSLASADDLNSIDTRDRFQLVLQVVGDFLQLGQSHLTGEAHHEDRELRDVDVLDSGVFRLLGKLWLSEVYFLADFLYGGVEIDLGVELHLYDRNAFTAR